MRPHDVPPRSSGLTCALLPGTVGPRVEESREHVLAYPVEQVLHEARHVLGLPVAESEALLMNARRVAA